MRYPPRLGHLATPAILVARLAPTYAASHEIDDDEAVDRMERAMRGNLLDDVLAATWQAFVGTQSRLDEQGLLEKIADSLKVRALRPGRETVVTPGWNAFLVRTDLEIGIASDAAKQLLESEEGTKHLAAGIEEVGRFLTVELTRK